MMFKYTQNISFTEAEIYDFDPSFVELIYKAFKYGKSKKNFKTIYKSYLSSQYGNDKLTELLKEMNILINRLNKNTLNIKELGIGKGNVIQFIRGVAYALGNLL